MEASILVAEDDRDIQNILRLYLEAENFPVTLADDGLAAWKLLHEQPFDLAIVDIMMPAMDGYELIGRVRQESSLPIIVVSAKGQDLEKILGLNLGADDYIAKPFNPLEVVARVRALLRRRGGSSASQTVCAGPFELDCSSCTLSYAGQSIVLTPTEYRIMNLLMHNPGRIFTKNQLHDALCDGEPTAGDAATVMVHISNLRAKIGDETDAAHHIVTVRGLGYKLVP